MKNTASPQEVSHDMPVSVCGVLGNSDQVMSYSVSNWGRNWCPCLVFKAAAFSVV